MQRCAPAGQRQSVLRVPLRGVYAGGPVAGGRRAGTAAVVSGSVQRPALRTGAGAGAPVSAGFAAAQRRSEAEASAGAGVRHAGCLGQPAVPAGGGNCRPPCRLCAPAVRGLRSPVRGDRRRQREHFPPLCLQHLRTRCPGTPAGKVLAGAGGAVSGEDAAVPAVRSVSGAHRCRRAPG